MSCEQCPLASQSEALLDASLVLHEESITLAKEKLREHREKVLPYLFEESPDGIPETVVALDSLNHLEQRLIQIRERQGADISRSDLSFQEALCDGPVFETKYIFFKGDVSACGSERRRNMCAGDPI